MKEHPILFSGPMVRAILEGRKTMTRRVACPPGYNLTDYGLAHCRYGQPGDRLWVRETWAAGACADMLNPSALSRKTWLIDNGGLWYEADGAAPLTPISPKGKTRPSIFMPRWASRILLEVTSVSVERVQDISETDAKAEGAPWLGAGFLAKLGDGSYREGFYDLWDSINAKRGYGWDANPWVWVVKFKRIEP